MAAHQAFFAGKLPHSFNGKKHFDTAASERKKSVKPQIWRLQNPESYRDSVVQLEGRNIKDGFRQKGYVTIGTGAMNWFDPGKPAPEHLISDFDHYRFFPNEESGDGRNLEQQVEWALEVIEKTSQPLFLFINVGETHHRYAAKGHELTCDWGDEAGCAAAQRASPGVRRSMFERDVRRADGLLRGDLWGSRRLLGRRRPVGAWLLPSLRDASPDGRDERSRDVADKTAHEPLEFSSQCVGAVRETVNAQ